MSTAAARAAPCARTDGRACRAAGGVQELKACKSIRARLLHRRMQQVLGVIVAESNGNERRAQRRAVAHPYAGPWALSRGTGLGVTGIFVRFSSGARCSACVAVLGGWQRHCGAGERAAAAQGARREHAAAQPAAPNRRLAVERPGTAAWRQRRALRRAARVWVPAAQKQQGLARAAPRTSLARRCDQRAEAECEFYNWARARERRRAGAAERGPQYEKYDACAR